MSPQTVPTMTIGAEVLVVGSAGSESAAASDSARRSQIARFDDVRRRAVVRCR